MSLNRLEKKIDIVPMSTDQTIVTVKVNKLKHFALFRGAEK